MRYTCLDVRSPDVNFLRKVMSSSRHDGAAYSRHPCRQSADADIVSAFPLSFSTFLENINILRQTSSTWHRIRREFYVLESFQKPVAPAGYKNKQCRKQTSVLSGRIVTAYVPLRSATGAHRTKVRACRVSYTLPRATGIISLTFKLISFTKVSCQNSFIVFS